MERCDQFLLKILASTPPLQPAEAQGLANWWLASRQESESLANFLVRHHVFRVEAILSIELMRKGISQYSDARHLFRDHGLERIRKGLGSNGHRKVTAIMTARAGKSNSAQATDTANRLVDPRAAKGVGRSEPTRRLTLAPPDQPARVTEIGSALGMRYLFGERLGHGTSGVVFLAQDLQLDLPVIVKLFYPRYVPTEPRARAEFRARVHGLAQVQHRHLVTILDFQDDPDFPYLVTEHVTGPSLAKLIQEHGRVSWPSVRGILVQALGGLAGIWKAGIIHGNVKPSNILIGRDGVKVADFGIGLLNPGWTEEGASTLALLLDHLPGSTAYLAPEHILGQTKLDHRCDVFALGATLYHALTGELPFKGRTRSEALHHFSREQLGLSSQQAGSLKPSQAAIILRMMAHDPRQRFRNEQEVLAALEESDNQR